MAAHDRYDTDVLRTLQRIANSLEKINKQFDRLFDTTQIYNIEDYAKEHPEWVEKIKAIAYGKKG